MAVRVIFDTDIGSDIDDAVALAYLLAKPGCDLLGITTVTGKPVERAKMASALCRAAGREIPIFPGAENPLEGAQKQPDVPQASRLHQWDHRQEFPRGQALEFLRSTVREYPGEVNLLATGPMTNIALLFATDPEIPSMLKSLVLMCGQFKPGSTSRGPVEWNACGDARATALTYAARPPLHRSLGLDVTTRCVMSMEEVRARFKAPLLAPVLDFAGVWAEHSDHMVFHDPLAAAMLFEPGICEWEEGLVSVEVASERLAGYTFWDPSAGGPHQVAVGVNADRFFDEYFGVF